MKDCEHCGNKFSRLDNLKRHQNTCQVQNQRNAVLERGVKHDTNSVKESNMQCKNNPLLTKSIINKIINDNPNENNEEDKNNTIQQIQSTSIGNGKDDSVRNLDKVPTIHEAAKKLKIIPESDDESSDDDSIIEDEYESDNEDMETNERKINEKEDENYENITKDELKDRLYTSSNIMSVFGLKLLANRALSNIEILEYIMILKVPKFRDVFHIDELPKKVNDVECGIVNLSSHEQMGTHWVCYIKIHKNRIFFDSIGRKTPLQIQKYLKTSEEFNDNTPTIQRNTDIVQRFNTKICGHLCLFVLTSLMRERFLSFHQVMDQLNCAFDENYY